MRRILLAVTFAAVTMTMSFSPDIKMRAVYYGDTYPADQITASGEYFDKNKLTCAHTYYKFGTLLEVTNLNTKKSVVVKVNDRGPRGYVDLTSSAFKQIANLRSGNVPVSVKVFDEL